MCIMRKHYGRCEGTDMERQLAYRAEFEPTLATGKWTREQFIEWFPREKARMTLEEVEAFANDVIASK